VPGEFDIIRRYFSRPARHALLAGGDDAALLAPRPGMTLAVSTDLLLEGRHFTNDAAARGLGHKVLAVNLSDMAAMGATPRWATLAIALPEADEAWLAAFAEGFYALAERFDVDLVGGDTTRGPRTFCVAVLGEVPEGQALTRAGARPGDDIWVSGELGGAAYALAHPQDAAAAKRLNEPEPRVALGERLRGLASAAIDVSDGFAQDLGHVLERSGAGAVAEYAALPKFPVADAAEEMRCALSGGDDYELLFTAPASARGAIEAIARELGLRLSRVGRIRAGGGLTVLDARGAPIALTRGFDHFA
jgi:thiamine-monophosphate kinase